ncbi:DUF2971 domain-containing protein [Yersinia ruckeri]|uniref:DUF2971 domain-containing protein n=1 Tax=Yersinia ruckeri TaxID=29486 RepID=UPI002815E53F|nr:DUF2971 domain-containing protein [Yersinia ruckeri]WMS07349.1 DUF2971 domain-containing protein [Yersinia ruckeri]
MAFYKYVKLADLKYFIKNKTIQFTNPHRFNDPFDCNFPFHDELFADVYERYVVKDMKKRCPDEHEDIAKCAAQLLQPKFDSIRNMIITPFRGMWDNYISNYRILCLSTDNDNLLMWSHYADQHKGAIVEIDITKLKLFPSISKNENFVMQGIVEYDKYYSYIKDALEKTLEIFNTSQDRNAIFQFVFDNLNNYFMYKMPEWRYENEYRMVISKNNDMLHADDTVSIEQGAIKRVILGCCHKKSDEYEDSVIMLEKNDIPYSIAVKNSYCIDIPEA